MRHFPYRVTLLLAVVLSTGSAIAAGGPLDGTKHDLSSAGPGPYKTISNNPADGGTTEICIFCHTPHSGNTEAPLWNRASSLANYQTYTSDVLAGLGGGSGYWAAEDPKYGIPHSKTRICLSCHDGTIALGSVAAGTGVPPFLNIRSPKRMMMTTISATVMRRTVFLEFIIFNIL